MDFIAAFASFVFGLLGVFCVGQLIIDGIQERVWNSRLTVVCALMALVSLAFLSASAFILISGPRFLPPFLLELAN
jgi:hypothetical protein